MTAHWTAVCDLNDIVPGSGVCALVGAEQVAVFRVGDTDLYAISNYDPFSEAFVLSRGIVGDRGGVLKVASPVYKQNFELSTGKCLDDESVVLPTYAVRLVEGRVEIASTDQEAS